MREPLARSRVIPFMSLAAVGAVLLYAGVLLVLWRFQERIVFQPPGDVAQRRSVPARAGSISRRPMASSCSLTSSAIARRTDASCSPSTAMPKSRAGSSRGRRGVTSDNRVCVMLPEYRGYDGLGGTPTYDGVRARRTRRARTTCDDTVGVPLGTSRLLRPFARHRDRRRARRRAERRASLVLQSPFSSARDMGARMYLPGLSAFWGLVSRVHFDTVAPRAVSGGAGVGRARR